MLIHCYRTWQTTQLDDPHREIAQYLPRAIPESSKRRAQSAARMSSARS